MRSSWGELTGEPHGMAMQPLRRLNLNLLYALAAILDARTLTEAGRIVSLSQPAMSMALRKLRENFGDDLIVYGKGGGQLTALGTALRPRIAQVLRAADETFALRLDFDPATAVRSIAIAAPEAIELMFLRLVVPGLLREGPGLDIRLMPFDYGAVDRMFDRGVDIAIVPEAMADHRFESRPLFDLGMAGLVWEGATHADAGLSAEAYLAAGHAALFERLERLALFGGTVDPMLAQRRIMVRTGLYSMLPMLVIETELIATVTDWLAQYYASILPVRLVSLPINAPLSRVVVQWQHHRSEEPMIRWLLGRVAAAVHWPLDPARCHQPD